MGPGPRQDDRVPRPDERIKTPRELQEEVNRSIFPEEDVPGQVPNQPGYPREHRDAWRDARRDYGGGPN